MENKVIDIIAEACGNEEIRENLKIDLIENGILDSLAFIRLISLIEENFSINIELSEVEAKTWRSIEEIIKLVKKHIK